MAFIGTAAKTSTFPTRREIVRRGAMLWALVGLGRHMLNQDGLVGLGANRSRQNWTDTSVGKTGLRNV